jgi:hypothetical protein
MKPSIRSKLLACLLVFVLPFLAGACQNLDLTGAELQRNPSRVLFQDDFSNPASGWVRKPTSPQGSLDYGENAYRISVIGRHSLLLSYPGLAFTDVSIHVETAKSGGPQDDVFGLVCRMKDKDNFYFLIISSDGYYGIGKVKDGLQSMIGMPALLPSEDILQGQANNYLRGDCVGDTLALHVNGILLSTVTDGEFSSGDVGLLAGTFEADQTDISFKNFSVLKP